MYRNHVHGFCVKPFKNRAHEVVNLYWPTERQILLPDDFFLPFGGKLNKQNRWVKLAQMISWWKVETHYGEWFKCFTKGQKAYSVRVALGALIIQELLGLSDRETVRQITENP